jgi:hypothetical protein
VWPRMLRSARNDETPSSRSDRRNDVERANPIHLSNSIEPNVRDLAA